MTKLATCPCTHTHLNVPLLAHGIDHTPLDGSPACAADRHAHLVMAGQAEKFAFQFPGFSCQLFPAERAAQS